MPPTLKDVAVHGGVGYATASKALNGSPGVSAATRRKVFKAVQELGYEPNQAARRLVMRSRYDKELSGTMAFIVPAENSLSEAAAFRSHVFIAAQQAVHQVGLRMVFTPVELDSDGTLLFVGLLSLRDIDGLLVLGNEFTTPEMLAALQRLDKPVVLLDYSCPETHLHSVTIDNAGGIRQAVKHLVDLGHRRIAMLNGPQGHPSARARLQGFHMANLELGLTFRNDWMLPGEFTLESGRYAAGQLAALNSRPTALICASDLMACGVLQRLYELGIRVPDDLSVIGFDDLEAVLTIPPLTSIRVETKDLGRLGGERILALRKNPDLEPYDTTIRTKLISRASCKEPWR